MVVHEITMDEYNISRKRDLELRANDLGISIPDSDYKDLDAVAAKLSRLIEEMNN